VRPTPAPRVAPGVVRSRAPARRWLATGWRTGSRALPGTPRSLGGQTQRHPGIACAARTRCTVSQSGPIGPANPPRLPSAESISLSKRPTVLRVAACRSLARRLSTRRIAGSLARPSAALISGVARQTTVDRQELKCGLIEAARTACWKDPWLAGFYGTGLGWETGVTATELETSSRPCVFRSMISAGKRSSQEELMSRL